MLGVGGLRDPPLLLGMLCHDFTCVYPLFLFMSKLVLAVLVCAHTHACANWGKRLHVPAKREGSGSQGGCAGVRVKVGFGVYRSECGCFQVSRKVDTASSLNSANFLQHAVQSWAYLAVP